MADRSGHPPGLVPDLATVAASFAGRLRAAGVPATTERAARFASMVEVARPTRVTELYWLARVTLVDQNDQFEAFDAVFAHVFGGTGDVAGHRGDPSAPVPDVRPGRSVRPGSAPAGGESDVPQLAGSPGSPRDDGGVGRLLMTASVEESLRHKDFATYTDDELARLRHLVEELQLAPPQRRSRRTAGATAGRRLDLRRTLRRSHRTAGDPVRRVYRRRRQRPRRVVLIADVSGSMEAYSRVYLHLLHGAARGARAEAFVLATRLTRLTRALASGHPDVALARATAAAPDWSGGTRLGDTLKTFLDTHGRRGMARAAVVVIVSDGWERADPALLGEQMQRLARLAHRVIWVNPRSAGEEYQPLVGGMAAALPHVDVFLSGHSLHAFDDVLTAVRAASGGSEPKGASFRRDTAARDQ